MSCEEIARALTGAGVCFILARLAGLAMRRDDRAVEGARLESVCTA